MGYAASKVIARTSSAFHVIMAGRSLEKVEAARAEIESSGDLKGTLSTIHLDVLDKTSIHDAAAQIAHEFGRLDVLINNAAVANLDPDLQTRLRINMETNFIGPALVSEAFRPLLEKSENPYSIYVSSGVGSLTRASDPDSSLYKTNSPVTKYGEGYATSKAALNMLALQQAMMNKDSMKIFMMCPGFVVSNLRRWGGDEANSGWGNAGDPAVSGETLLSIVEGKRDADVGKFVHKDGVYPW